MLDHINLERVLFLDIETVPAFPEYTILPEKIKKLWDTKAEFIKDRKAESIKKDENYTPDLLYERAGIYAEFGKIICISVGILKNNEIRIKSYFGDDEANLLKEFSYMLKTYYKSKDYFLCAHNGKEFDFPYIARRLLINNLPLPAMLDLAGKKPWEIPHLDTLELWKFGDYKSYTSLDLLTTIFDIPTPKDDIDGSDVARVYWKDKDLDRIVKYCQKDVISVIQLFLKYKGLQMIDESSINYVE